MSSLKSSKCSLLFATSKNFTAKANLEMIRGCIIKSPHLAARAVHCRPGTRQKRIHSDSVAVLALITPWLIHSTCVLLRFPTRALDGVGFEMLLLITFFNM